MTQPFSEFNGVTSKEYWEKKTFKLLSAKYRDAGEFTNNSGSLIQYDEAYKFEIVCIEDKTTYQNDHDRTSEEFINFSGQCDNQPTNWEQIQKVLQNGEKPFVKLVNPIGRVNSRTMKIYVDDIQLASDKK